MTHASNGNVKGGPPRQKSKTAVVEASHRAGKEKDRGTADARASIQAEKVCNRYNTSEGCKFGDKCRFKHEDLPTPDPEPTPILMVVEPEKPPEPSQEDVVPEVQPIDERFTSVMSEVPTFVDEKLLDVFRARVQMYFYQLQLNADREKLCRSRMERLMTVSGITIDGTSFRACKEVMEEELAKCLQIASSHNTFEFNMNQSLLSRRRLMDAEEGLAAALPFWDFRYYYYSMRRSIRLTWMEWFEGETTHEVATISNHSHVETTCPRESLNRCIETMGKPGMAYTVAVNQLDFGKPADEFYFKATPAARQECVPRYHAIQFTTVHPLKILFPSPKCAEAEAVAVVTRQQVRTHPESTSRHRARVFRVGVAHLRKVWAVKYDPDALTTEEKREFLLKGRPKRQQNVFRQGFKAIDRGDEIDYRSKAFVKVEPTLGKRLVDWDPRNICGGRPEHMGEFGPEYYYYQKMIVRELQQLDIHVTKVVYTGGMDALQVGALFTDMVDSGYHFIEIDLSRCDGHNSKEANRAERLMMEYHGCPPPLVESMRHADKTEGVTACGHKFGAGASQESGRQNTSFGTTKRLSCILMACAHVLSIWMEDDKPSAWDALNEEADERWLSMALRAFQLGDDGVVGILPIITNKLGADRVLDMLKYVFKIAGHKAKAKFIPNDESYRVSFCSGWFWTYGDGKHVLGLKPFRTVSRSFVTKDPILTPSDMLSYAKGVAVSMRHFRFVPVLGTIIQQLLTQTHGVNTLKYTEDNPYKTRLDKALVVNMDDINHQFTLLYGMHPSEFKFINSIDWCKTGSVVRHPAITQGNIIDEVELP